MLQALSHPMLACIATPSCFRSVICFLVPSTSTSHSHSHIALIHCLLRWRTALIIRELENEVEALARGRPHRKQLKELMAKKEMVSDVFNQVSWSS